MSIELISSRTDVDYQVIEEFLSEYNEAQSEIENLLISLENNPSDDDLLNNLFRKVHSIKGNSHFLGMHLMTDFVHSLETLLDKLRKGDVIYNPLLGDVILKAVDQIGCYVDNTRINNKKGNPEINFHAESTTKNFRQNIYSDILKINSPPSEPMANFIDNDEQRKKDLVLFAQIIEKAEQRSPLWSGRTKQVLSIARDLNRESGYRVDPMQLEAAILLHDLGMVFLPLDQINRSEPLTTGDRHSLKLHPNMGASLIAGNPNWQQAADIIMQHHEREDGRGYPSGLSGNQICDGAKILAIAGTIEAIVNRRANCGDKYPVIHAIREINKNDGTQFSPYWVSIFNRVIRSKNKNS